MECLKEPAAETLIPDADVDVGGGARRGSVVVDLPLGEAAVTFDLEKAVCSHGLFMMAPSQLDLLSKTILSPLRLDSDADTDNGLSLLSSSSPTSLIVRISHPSDSPHSLRLRVFGTDSLSSQHQKNFMVQRSLSALVLSL